MVRPASSRCVRRTPRRKLITEMRARWRCARKRQSQSMSTAMSSGARRQKNGAASGVMSCGTVNGYSVVPARLATRRVFPSWSHAREDRLAPVFAELRSARVLQSMAESVLLSDDVTYARVPPERTPAHTATSPTGNARGNLIGARVQELDKASGGADAPKLLRAWMFADP